MLRSVSCSWQLPAWALTPRHWAAMHFEKVDEILGLAAKGQKSVMACALGYRSSDDWNADAPKSRFPLDAVATIL